MTYCGKFFPIKMTQVGFQNFVAAAMVLAAVERLSDDDGPGPSNPATAKAEAKPKSTPKGSPSAKKTPKVKAAAKSASKAKPNAKNKAGGGKKKRATPPAGGKEENDEEQELDDEDIEEEEVVPKKRPSSSCKVLKRPAGRNAKAEKPLKVGKYIYPNGRWGFKYGGKEIMGVSQPNLLCKDLQRTHT